MKNSTTFQVVKQPKIPKKKPAKSDKRSSYGITMLGFDECARFSVNSEVWEVYPNGELLIRNGNHVFKCTWRPDGTLWSYLYTDMKVDEARFKTIISVQQVREFLAANTKRNLPQGWAE